MRSHLIQIGNSRGVRLPKPILEQAGLTDEIEIRVERRSIIISAARSPRAGWGEAIDEHGVPEILDAASGTRFDDEEWEWE